MTSNVEVELYVVERLCNHLNIYRDIHDLQSLEPDDPPDVEFKIEGRLIGVECMTYKGSNDQSTIDAKNRYQRCLDQYLEYVELQAEKFNDLNVSEISFRGFSDGISVLPPINLFEELTDQLFNVIEKHRSSEPTEKHNYIESKYLMHSGFPLVTQYINKVCYSAKYTGPIKRQNLKGGVTFKDDILCHSIRVKSGKIEGKRLKGREKIDRFDELWLLIHDGNSSPMISSYNVLRDYIPLSETNESIIASPFDKVFVMTFKSAFEIRINKIPIEHTL